LAGPLSPWWAAVSSWQDGGRASCCALGRCRSWVAGNRIRTIPRGSRARRRRIHLPGDGMPARRRARARGRSMALPVGSCMRSTSTPACLARQRRSWLSSASTRSVGDSTRSCGTVRGAVSGGQDCVAADWLRRPRDVGAASGTKMAAWGAASGTRSAPRSRWGAVVARATPGASRPLAGTSRRGAARLGLPGHSVPSDDSTTGVVCRCRQVHADC